MPEINITDLQGADREEWQSLWQGYLEFYETELSGEMIDLAFQRLTGPDANEFRGLIARLGSRAVGLAHTLTHRHGWQKENVVYLQDLFVTPEARGRGVARALISEVYKRADAARTPQVYWLTAKDNKTARNLYDKVAHKTGFLLYRR